jgi:hypothetical protein
MVPLAGAKRNPSAGCLSPTEALPLAARTASLSLGELPASTHFWDLAAAYAAADKELASVLIDHVIRAQTKDWYEVCQVARVSEVLRTILQSESAAVRERVTRLIHWLGEQGLEQFGDLFS